MSLSDAIDHRRDRRAPCSVLTLTCNADALGAALLRSLSPSSPTLQPRGPSPPPSRHHTLAVPPPRLFLDAATAHPSGPSPSPSRRTRSTRRLALAGVARCSLRSPSASFALSGGSFYALSLGRASAPSGPLRSLHPPRQL
eukprot:2508887-Rhodomonas_salina.1